MVELLIEAASFLKPLPPLTVAGGAADGARGVRDELLMIELNELRRMERIEAAERDDSPIPSEDALLSA
jgi:hypothetical protein